MFKDSVGNVSQRMTSSLVNVGGSVWTNAFPTMVYTFRYDFGLIGVAFNSFLFGFLAQYAYIRLRSCKSTRTFLIYMVAIYFILESPMRWDGLHFWPYFVFLMIYVSTRSGRKRQLTKSVLR